MKFRNLLGCATALSLLLAVPSSVSAGPAGSDCATVTIHATNSSGTVAPGNTIGLSGMYQNCSERKARYTYEISAMSSCGQKVALASGRVSFNPDQARIWSVSYQFPTNTCSGEWEATIKLYANGNRGMMDSASTTVMIE